MLNIQLLQTTDSFDEHIFYVQKFVLKKLRATAVLRAFVARPHIALYLQTRGQVRHVGGQVRVTSTHADTTTDSTFNVYIHVAIVFSSLTLRVIFVV